jgi:hypothetical protein
LSRAPRIDTITNRVTATRALLEMVEPELRDLHVLAYDRYTARRDVMVRGGEKDYALDNHGDKRARKAYRRLGTATSEACELIAEAAHDAIALLREHTHNGRAGPHSIEAEELAAAIEAQARRAARAEYTPVARIPQPGAELAARTVDQLRRERDEARADADRLARRLAHYETPNPPTTKRHRGWRRHKL